MCNIGHTSRAASAGYFDRSNSCVRLGHPILLTKAFGTVYQTAKSECKHPCSTHMLRRLPTLQLHAGRGARPALAARRWSFVRKLRNS